MDLGALRKIAGTSAARICEAVELSEPARAALAPGLNPAGFLNALVEGGLWSDAIRFLAFALPVREGVWWACVAARASLGPAPKPGMAAAIAAAEEWVYHPSDETRRAAFPPAEALGFESPPAYAALAAYWSGGSLAPVESSVVPPDPKLSPTAIAAAVLLSAVLREPQKAVPRYKALIASGIGIANGGNGKLDAVF